MRDQPLSARPEAAPRAFTAPLVLPNGAVPRLWTVFAACLGVLAVYSWFVSIAGGILASRLAPDVAAFVFLALLQVAVGAAAVIPAVLSREPTRTRLGLVRPGLPAWSHPILVLAVFVPWTVGVLLGQAVELIGGFGEGRLLTDVAATGELAVPLYLFVALVPSVLEELFFRGYVQRRLLQRWSPPVAILVSSLLFAVAHVSPRLSTFAFVIGLWLGVLAWRTGSVWPGIVCHAVANGVVTSFQVVVLAHSNGDPSSDLVLLLVGAVVLGLIVLALASFPVAVWLLARRRVREPRAIGLPEPVAA